MDTVHEFKARRINGDEIDLSSYKDEVLLIVNGASKCGYTPQYKDLQALYQKYRERGLRILLFPCNDFLHQEEDDEQTIQQFCSVKFGVEFDLFEKVKILGSEPHPLYQFLQACGKPAVSPGGLKPTLFSFFKKLAYFLMGKKPQLPAGVQWNFHKFLISRKGEVVSHFLSEVEPFDPELIRQIESELDA
ncbi:MAG: glutathione peroxidase [Candidatus Nitrohelix vancouverensis]|uniref:Glutathione peroxidase n=1 Tax=Candidatus Nitrohelix vancouverensis TaxID=2705534 RepID=A0A7T0C343_9BACT|nr:MAG: glutathione peroxidase [Candidatus Nitrohelix vancouverensis]